MIAICYVRVLTNNCVLLLSGNSKIITASTNHFSGFLSTTKYTRIYTSLVKVDNTIGALVEITSEKYGENKRLGLVYTLPIVWNGTGYWNAKDIINQYLDVEVLSVFKVTLKRKIFWGSDEEIQSKKLIVKRIENSFGTHGYEVYEDSLNSSNKKYSLDQGQNEQIFETFMQGIPLIFKFDEDEEFVPNEDHKYYVNVEWALANDISAMYVARYTHLYDENNRKEAKKIGSMIDWDNDNDPENYVNDNFESGSGTNEPPNPPTGETPSHEATDVSINTNLSWNCSDPDDDPLDYDIYFGEDDDPPLVEEYYNSTNYDPGQLQENTTYYWYIVAFDDHDHNTVGPVWEFTTAEGGGGNTPPTAVFTVDPTSGTTSTIFEFDGSDSYDNEDPTSDLQVRWDFDGDGSWDTGWDYDKTENHQYSTEGTYTAKMELKDTEGLTDYTTQTVTIDNGGGGTGTFTDPRDGQEYEYVEIGSQTWMAENLNYETGNSWCYDNNSSNCATYGRLYDWSTALGACPSGWHLPSDDEWCTLTTYIDPTVDCDETGWSGTDAGYKMKSTSAWYSNGNGSDAYGFAALPGGYRNYDGSFDYVEESAYFWSSTESGTHAWHRGLDYDIDGVYRDYRQEDGFSVRCLKD